MIDFSGIDFSTAESNYFVANTPLFLIKKLRLDAAVLRLRTSFSTEELVDDLRERLTVSPTSVRERVIPLALIVAIAAKQDRKALVESANMETGDHRWFKLIADTLVEQAIPTSTATLNGRVLPQFSTGTPRPTASTSYATLDAR